MKEKISVVVLTRGRAAMLRACLDSVLDADLSRVAEVLIVVNGPDPEAEAEVARAAVRRPIARLLTIAASSRGRARNLGAREAKGGILHFLDDDVTVPRDLFTATARRFADDPRIAAVGGPNLTPPKSAVFERAAGRALASRLGAWRMRARYAAVGVAREAGEESLMLCSLALRADADGPGGLRFDESLASAEENLLLERVRRRGGRLIYDPALFVFHRRRSSWRAFAQQAFRSGAGRLQTIWRLPSIARPIHFAPAALVVYAAWLLGRGRADAAVIPAAFYAAWLAAEAARAFEQDGPLAGALTPALIALLHAAYAAGFMLGPWLWAAPETAPQRRSTTSAPPMPPPAQAASKP